MQILYYPCLFIYKDAYHHFLFPILPLLLITPCYNHALLCHALVRQPQFLLDPPLTTSGLAFARQNADFSTIGVLTLHTPPNIYAPRWHPKTQSRYRCILTSMRRTEKVEFTIDFELRSPPDLALPASCSATFRQRYAF